MKLLLSQGVDINARGGAFNGTALCEAARGGVTGMVRMLLDQHADLNISDENGNTPLLLTLSNDDDEILKMLLKKGADVNAFNDFGDTALVSAARVCHVERVEVLVNGGADLDAQSRGLGTALQAASWQGHEKTVKVLLKHKADVDAQDRDLVTALHIASFHGHEKIVSLLLDNGARMDIPYGKYGTVLRAARKGQRFWQRLPKKVIRCINVEQLLLQHGAVAEAEDDGEDGDHWGDGDGGDDWVIIRLASGRPWWQSRIS